MALKAGWAAARNILAVRLDSMGDVLMTTPALAAMRLSSPDVRLTLLTSIEGAQTARHVDVVDDTLAYAAPWVAPAAKPSSHRADLAFVNTLAQRRFDAAVIFTVCTQSALPAALACRLAGIPLRLAHSRENPYALLTDWVRDPDVRMASARHEVQRQLDLVREVGFEAQDQHLRVRYHGADALRMQAALAGAGGDVHRPYIVVHAGARAASRRYPAPLYGVVARALQARTGMQLVFTGSDGEADLVWQAAAQMSQAPVNLVGKLGLGELAALLDGAQALLCNNTGPAHMAAALGTPVVVLYALTNPQHTPWQVPARVLSHDVPCRNCLKSRCPEVHHDCLLRIAPETVVEATLELLSRSAALPRHRAAAPVHAHVPGTMRGHPHDAAQPVPAAAVG